MATAPTVSIQWIPEDDLLLKNAVEAGASLEALAKGAVLFSRRYTLRELRERWHSLIYDPDISARAAAQIFELEISGINPASKLNKSEIGSKEVSHKRTSVSIRRKYYAMRKKFRSELFSNSDLGFFEPNPHELNEQSADFQKQVMQAGNPLIRGCMMGDDISDHLGLQEEDLDILRHAFPGTIRDIAVASCATNASGCFGLDGNHISSLTEGGNSFSEVGIRNGKGPLSLRKSSIDEHHHNSSVGFEATQQFNPNSDGFHPLQTIVFAHDQPHLHHWRSMQDVSDSKVPVSMSLQNPAQVVEDTILNDVEGKENCSTACTGEFADPDSLLNLSNEDEMSLEDTDVKMAAKKCSVDDAVLIVQDSIEDCHDNDTTKTEVELVAEIIPVNAPSAKPMISEASTSSFHGDQQINSQTEADTSSNSILISDFTELGDGKICCTLNTEDTEIPCNDDIFLLIHPSTSFGSSAIQSNTTGPMPSAVHEKDYEQALDFSKTENDSAKGFVWPHMHCLPESHVQHHAAKTESHDSRPQALLPGSSKYGLQYAIPKLCNNILAKKGVIGSGIKNGQNPATVTEIIQSTGAVSTISQHPESVVDFSLSDEEESEFDDDVPYFSDIEAMVLEMDLDPYDQNCNSVKQDPSYQYDETKRTIIRLEQAARSCLQRAMTSQEALAILYGRHLRHYIKKPEVLLGRSTDDIDLRKKGELINSRLLRLGGSSVGIRTISGTVTSNAKLLYPVDTLALAKKLEKQGIEPKQAQAMTEAMMEVLKESVETSSASFASKNELIMLKAEMKNSQDNHCLVTRNDMDEMKAQSRFDIEKVANEREKAANEQTLDLNLKIGILRDEVIKKNEETMKVTSKLEGEIHALRGQLEVTKYELIKYCIGTMASTSAVGIVVLRYMM